MDRSANSQPTDPSTAHGFVRFLARMMNYENDFPFPGVEEDTWINLEVGEPIANTLIVTIHEKQYIVSVKPVSK